MSLSHLPQYLTPFIGRKTEVAEILRLFDHPDCRLLTLVGAGGSGKTRLLLQVAAARQDSFADGVHFVPLQPLDSPDHVVSAVVDALGLSLAGPGDAHTQLLAHVQSKELLLLLDNFEQLLPAAELLTEILQTAPGVKLLVTSREGLNLQEEWLYAVLGLHIPAEAQPAEYAACDAVQLFAERAQRVRPDFDLSEECTAIVRICQLVEGSPLALELAASWTKSLPCAAIAEEIARDLDFLTARLRNVPDRHQSIRVVFEHSWKLLRQKERMVFARLAIFRGGFSRAAAETVAGAALATLTALVDKSFLRWEPHHRYQIHELLRQYAEEQLAQWPDELARTRDLHSRYYTELLGDQINSLTTQQREAMARTNADLDNIRVAWQWATEQAQLDYIGRAAMPLFAFCQGQSRYLEGVEMLAAAFDTLSNLPPSPARERALADLLTGRGWLEMRLGRVEEATQALERAHQLYVTGDFVPAPVMGADPLAALPVLAVIRGDYAGAMVVAEQARQAASARNDPANLALAGYGLTSAAIAQGRYNDALDHARETLALTESMGNRWFLAYVYNHLGEITQVLGDLAAAKEYYQSSYAIREEFDDPEGMAVALNHLGEIALLEQAYRRAQELYRQSLALYEGLGDQGGLARALYGLGMAAHGVRDEALARHQLQRALHVAAEAQITPLILSILVGIGSFLLECGSPQHGLAALTFVQHHPASEQMAKDSVRQILADAKSLHDAPAEGEMPQVDVLVSDLLVELSAPQIHSGDGLASAPPSGAPVEQPLLEPLSARELEVLALIADGLKNREIAEQLYVTLSTVKAHSNNIYRKLDVNNRVQAIARARELDLL